MHPWQPKAKGAQLDPYVDQNPRSRGGPSDTREWKTKNVQSIEWPKSLALLLWGGKKLKPRWSEDLIEQSVESNETIRLSNVENDLVTAVDSEVPFEIPPVGVVFLNGRACKVRIRIGLTKRVMHYNVFEGLYGIAKFNCWGLFETAKKRSYWAHSITKFENGIKSAN